MKDHVRGANPRREDTFKIVFAGALKEGAQAHQVQQRFKQLFNIRNPLTIKRLFSGRTVVMKKGLGREMAETYQRAIENAGALCTLEPDHSLGHFDPPDQAYQRRKKRLMAEFSNKELGRLGVE